MPVLVESPDLAVRIQAIALVENDRATAVIDREFIYYSVTINIADRDGIRTEKADIIPSLLPDSLILSRGHRLIHHHFAVVSAYGVLSASDHDELWPAVHVMGRGEVTVIVRVSGAPGDHVVLIILAGSLECSM